MIKQIRVDNLYGEFNHVINVKEDNISLILGDNGLGKTIILKMIKNLFDNNLLDFGNYEFDSFSVTLSDNSNLEIARELKIKSTKYLRYPDYLLNITYKKDQKKAQKFSIKSDDIIEHYRNGNNNASFRRHADVRIRHMIRNFIPNSIEQIGPDKWLNLSTGMFYSSIDLVKNYSEFFPKDLIEDLQFNSVPEWFHTLIKSLNVKLVETQRLLTKNNSDEKEYKNTVLQYSNELKEIIKIKAIEATNLSTKLDRTYTNRLIHKITSTNKIQNAVILKSLKDLDIKRTFLIKVGLLEPDDEAVLPINLTQNYSNETLRDVLEIHIDDSNEKLSVYYDLSQKLNTLIDIINKRFNYKIFSINKTEGFVFKSTKTNNKIPLTNLSSGEQHELVLFYELLFNTPENSLILIDEPEISLHIKWQNEFINDLKEIGKLINMKAIIATHSPDIINNNWDLTIEL